MTSSAIKSNFALFDPRLRTTLVDSPANGTTLTTRASRFFQTFILTPSSAQIIEIRIISAIHLDPLLSAFVTDPRSLRGEMRNYLWENMATALVTIMFSPRNGFIGTKPNPLPKNLYPIVISVVSVICKSRSAGLLW